MSTGVHGTARGGPDVEVWRRHPRTALAGSAVVRLGPVEHVAVGLVGEVPGRAAPPLSWVLDGCLWAVGRLPDEVVARGSEADLTALLSWDGADPEVEAEVRVAQAGRPAQWLVVTCQRGEVELRAPVFLPADEPGELWVSDGTGTERTTVPASPPAPEGARAGASGAAGAVLQALLAAVRTSAADGGAPVRPGS